MLQLPFLLSYHQLKLGDGISDEMHRSGFLLNKASSRAGSKQHPAERGIDVKPSRIGVYSLGLEAGWVPGSGNEHHCSGSLGHVEAVNKVLLM